MKIGSSFLAVLAALGVSALVLAGCHVPGHAPPGQVKQVVNPPPGHGGTPPGQEKKK